MSSDSARSNDPSTNPETCPIEGMTQAQIDSLVHLLTAKRLVEALRCRTSAGEGAAPLGMSPGLLQAALRFLSDNDITGPIPTGIIEQVKKDYGPKAPFKLAQ